MALPTDYTDAVTPTGATTELPATTTRGINAFATQINTNTTALTTVVSGSNNGTATALTLWIGTAAQYAAVDPKSSTTVYVVTA